jgi:hypothetical protein
VSAARVPSKKSSSRLVHAPLAIANKRKRNPHIVTAKMKIDIDLLATGIPRRTKSANVPRRRNERNLCLQHLP